jgi:hypothetical protein
MKIEPVRWASSTVGVLLRFFPTKLPIHLNLPWLAVHLTCDLLFISPADGGPGRHLNHGHIRQSQGDSALPVVGNLGNLANGAVLLRRPDELRQSHSTAALLPRRPHKLLRQSIDTPAPVFSRHG